MQRARPEDFFEAGRPAKGRGIGVEASLVSLQERCFQSRTLQSTVICIEPGSVCFCRSVQLGGVRGRGFGGGGRRRFSVKLSLVVLEMLLSGEFCLDLSHSRGRFFTMSRVLIDRTHRVGAALRDRGSF